MVRLKSTFTASTQARTESTVVGPHGQGLGEAFTDEAQEAWAEAYAILSTTMQDAAALPV